MEVTLLIRFLEVGKKKETQRQYCEIICYAIMEKSFEREIASRKLLDILARIRDMMMDKRVENIGALKVLVHIWCDVYNVQDRDCVKRLFNQVCRNCLGISNPGMNWTTVNVVGKRYMEKEGFCRYQ